MTGQKRTRSGSGRVAAGIAAVMFLLGALWRGVIAWQHHVKAQTIINDPSIQELEEVSALLESGAAVVLLIHAILLAVATRRRFAFPVPHALAVAALCALVLAGTLGSAPILENPGVYPLTIVTGVAIISLRLRFGWLSAYVGAVSGCVLAWYSVVPVSDAFACLFVTIPCVVYVLAGAGVSRGLARFTERDVADA